MMSGYSGQSERLDLRLSAKKTTEERIQELASAYPHNMDEASNASCVLYGYVRTHIEELLTQAVQLLTHDQSIPFPIHPVTKREVLENILQIVHRVIMPHIFFNHPELKYIQSNVSNTYAPMLDAVYARLEEKQEHPFTFKWSTFAKPELTDNLANDERCRKLINDCFRFIIDFLCDITNIPEEPIKPARPEGGVLKSLTGKAQQENITYQRALAKWAKDTAQRKELLKRRDAIDNFLAALALPFGMTDGVRMPHISDLRVIKAVVACGL